MYPRVLASRTIGVSNNKKQPFTEEYCREEWFKILCDKCQHVVSQDGNDEEQDLQDEMKQFLIKMYTHKHEHEGIIREQFIQCFMEMSSPFNYVDLTKSMIEKVSAEEDETGQLKIILDTLVFKYWMYCRIVGREENLPSTYMIQW